MRGHEGTQRGFTLLEVLLVISLLGVLLVLVAGALLGANRAVLKAERYTVNLDEIRAAQAFLRSSIAQALPLDTSGEDDVNSGFFEGSAQQLRFVATLPGELGGGIQVHSLSSRGRKTIGLCRCRSLRFCPVRMASPSNPGVSLRYCCKTSSR